MKNSQKFDLRKFLKENTISSGTAKSKDLIVETKINLIFEGSINNFVKKTLDTELKGIDPKTGEFQWFVNEILKGALVDANFHDEAKQVDKLFPKAKLGTYTKKSDLTGNDVSFKGKEKHFGGEMRKVGAKIANKAKWDGYDITQAISLFIGKHIDPSIAHKVEQLGYEQE